MSPADKNIAIFSEQINLPLFCQKEEDLLSLFHKMLEGLQYKILVVQCSIGLFWDDFSKLFRMSWDFFYFASPLLDSPS